MKTRRHGFLLLLVPLALLAGGCGSDKESSTPTISLLPPAQTAEEWAERIVNRLLRPMNRNVEVLSTLDNPQTKIYIVEQNKTTLNVLNRRMSDLRKCSARLVSIGPPPPPASTIRQLRLVDAALHRACLHYVKVADIVLLAVDLMSSGRDDVVVRGQRKLAEAGPDARTAATAYDEAVQIARKLPEFQFHGLKPSA